MIRTDMCHLYMVFNFNRLILSRRIQGIVLTIIDHFTVACLVAWPLNESEAGGDLVLIETSLLFSC